MGMPIGIILSAGNQRQHRGGSLQPGFGAGGAGTVMTGLQHVTVCLHSHSQYFFLALLPQISCEQHGKLSAGDPKRHGGRIRIRIFYAGTGIEAIEPRRAVLQYHALSNRADPDAGASGKHSQLLSLFFLPGGL